MHYLCSLHTPEPWLDSRIVADFPECCVPELKAKTKTGQTQIRLKHQLDYFFIVYFIVYSYFMQVFVVYSKLLPWGAMYDLMHYF